MQLSRSHYDPPATSNFHFPTILYFIVIGYQSLVTDPCSPIPAIGSAGFAKRIQSAGPSSEGCQVLDKDCLMIVNGEVYLSPPSPSASQRRWTTTRCNRIQPSTTTLRRWNRSWVALGALLGDPETLLGRSWTPLGRSWMLLGTFAG